MSSSQSDPGLVGAVSPRHRVRLVVEVDNVVLDPGEFHRWLTELAIEVESDLKNGEIVAAAYWERAK